MSHTVTLIPGDGIGPEVTEAVLRIIAVAGVSIEWLPYDAGLLALERHGTTLPLELLDSIRRTRVALKGPVTTPIGEGFTSVNVGLRKSLSLFANVRPVWSIEGVPSRYSDIDLVIVRENTEDLYSGLEHEVVPGVVESLKVITQDASMRIARFAFDYARRNARKSITAVHKANIMKLGDGLFLKCVRAVARENVDIAYNERIVDAVCMQLVINPHQFDLLVLPNLYGDIVSDLCAGLVGGLGVVPGANLGEDVAVFEAVHGSAPDIAGKNLANPTALLLSALMMLRHLDEHAAADRIMQALGRVLAAGTVRTGDLGGSATTTEFTSAVCLGIERDR
ncbi:MAG TPA: isocitrate dehydrogenase (NAD(+)) [Vicinamibacterales bacterium]|nr:isocitrate dehydrogenase (NAD(+)) [Vicinamibacterales bacterium]